MRHEPGVPTLCRTQTHRSADALPSGCAAIGSGTVSALLTEYQSNQLAHRLPACSRAPRIRHSPQASVRKVRPAASSRHFIAFLGGPQQPDLRIKLMTGGRDLWVRGAQWPGGSGLPA